MIHNKCHHNKHHSREGGNPVNEPRTFLNGWVPAFAGMTKILIAIYMLTPLVLVNSVQAGGLGRLFFTPEQRAQLEYEHERIRNAPAENGSPSSILTVNGIVQKKGGGRTVWINGVAWSAGDSDERSPEALPVPVPGQANPVKVKVGQKLILDQPIQKKPPISVPSKQPAPDD